MVLGVAIVGTMIYKPPRSALDVALYAGGTYLGLMLVDSYSSGMMIGPNLILMGQGGGCGCPYARN
jgi:hypothetical protein